MIKSDNHFFSHHQIFALKTVADSKWQLCKIEQNNDFLYIKKNLGKIALASNLVSADTAINLNYKIKKMRSF